MQNPRVNDAIQTALERGELTVTVDGYLAALTAQSGEKLFHAIKYGDDEHRAWLKDAIEAFFAGSAGSHGCPSR